MRNGNNHRTGKRGERERLGKDVMLVFFWGVVFSASHAFRHLFASAGLLRIHRLDPFSYRQRDMYSVVGHHGNISILASLDCLYVRT